MAFTGGNAMLDIQTAIWEYSRKEEIKAAMAQPQLTPHTNSFILKEPHQLRRSRDSYHP